MHTLAVLPSSYVAAVSLVLMNESEAIDSTLGLGRKWYIVYKETYVAGRRRLHQPTNTLHPLHTMPEAQARDN
jgi:hypothetical protein